MANQEQAGKALAAIPEQQSLMTIVQQAAKEVKLNPTHILRVAATAIRLNPKLAKCTPESFVGSLIALEQVGLEPVAGRAYLLPFMNNRKVFEKGGEKWVKVAEVQALIGYKGYSDLFYRHEAALSLEAHVVHEKDFFEYEYGTASFLRHKPAIERGPAIAYYAIAKLKDSGVLFLVMSKTECIEHGKKHSKVFDKKKGAFMPGTPWVDDEDSMCKKTVMLQLTKNLPLSIETQRALSIDETSRHYRPGVKDALDLPDETNWQEDPIDTTAAPAEEAPKAAPAAAAATAPAKDEPAKPTPTRKIPENVMKTIANTRTKVGEKIFFEVLGGLGCTTLEEIADIPTANKLITEMVKAHTRKEA